MNLDYASGTGYGEFFSTFFQTVSDKTSALEAVEQGKLV